MANAVTDAVSGVTNLGPRAVKQRHPLYAIFLPEWTRLWHVREGIGGFMDGTYLVAHPREWEDYTSVNPTKPTKKLKARRELACYENFAATIIEAMKSALFRGEVSRRVGEDAADDQALTDLEQWWENVDGHGTGIDDFMRMVWDIAATFGYVAIYLDRPAAATPAATKADEPWPVLRFYTPMDVIDWRQDDQGALTAIRFVEPAEEPGIDQLFRPQLQYRTVTKEYWALHDQQGKLVDKASHSLGTLPVAVLYSQRRPLTPFVGLSLLNHSNLFIDVYNLTSELRELLRNQTFGVLNVPLGADGDVEKARQMIGGTIATDNILFSGLAASYISPDAANVAVYQAEIGRRLRIIYRLAGMPWEADSKDAEAQGSLKLKREDMNQRLAAYADECEKTEYRLVELFYRATEGEAWEAQLEKDTVVIPYPDTFDVTPFDVVLEQAQAAMSLGMPIEVLKEIRKSLLSQFLPGLDEKTLDTLLKAIDAAPDDSLLGQARDRVKTTMQAVKDSYPKPDTKAAA